MADNWDYYLSSINGEPASIFVNMSLKSTGPDPELPYSAWLRVNMNAATQEGLSAPEELNTLNAIEDTIGAVMAPLNTKYAGRITNAGRREFCYYVESADRMQQAVARAMGDFPEYKYAFDMKLDPDWEQYLDVLYPANAELQAMENRKLLEFLRESGDKLEKPRPVDHYCYFCRDNQRDAFAAWAVTFGFAVRLTSLAAGTSNKPFCAILTRVDHVDQCTIDQVTMELTERANALGGVYDGWETQVIQAGSKALKPSIWQNLLKKD